MLVWKLLVYTGRGVSLFEQVVALEYACAEVTLPRGVPGLNAGMFKSHLRFIANRRAVQIGLPALYPQEDKPFRRSATFLKSASSSIRRAGR